jgi:hypothetical protein
VRMIVGRTKPEIYALRLYQIEIEGCLFGSSQVIGGWDSAELQCFVLCCFWKWGFHTSSQCMTRMARPESQRKGSAWWSDGNIDALSRLVRSTSRRNGQRSRELYHRKYGNWIGSGFSQESYVVECQTVPIIFPSNTNQSAISWWETRNPRKRGRSPNLQNLLKISIYRAKTCKDYSKFSPVYKICSPKKPNR